MGLMILDGGDPEYLRQSPKVFLYADDQRLVEYHFKLHYNTEYDDPKKCYGLLNLVKTSDKHWIGYDYDEHTTAHRERCIFKTAPDQRYLEIGYYPHGDRVKSLSQPALNNQKIETRRFVYHFFDDKEKGFRGGKTDVFDHENHLSSYTYNKEYRPTEILHFLGSKKNFVPDIRHKLYWGDHKKDQETCLTARIVAAERGPEYKGRSFEYDERGNITKETFYGNLTGSSPKKVAFNPIGRPTQEGESYFKKYSYADKELNNLSKEVHENGLEISYNYFQSTDRIKKRTIRGGGFEQHFSYRYHPCGALIESIEESGKTSLITRHTPKLSKPCYGFAAVTSTFFKDPKSPEETPLTSTHFTYNRLGKPTTLKVYDAKGNLSYTEAYQYDEIGCCIKETTRTGQVIEREFDANGNLLKEIGPEELYVKSCQYDLMNRLTKETMTLKNGTSWTTRYGYNASGALTHQLDPYGQRTDYENDRYNRPIKIIYPEIDGIRPFERKEYDIFGNVTLFQDRQGNITQTTYNSYDKPVSVRCPDGTTETYKYYKDGSLKSFTDKSGLKTRYEYDNLGRILKKTVLDAVEIYTYDHTLLTSITNYNGVTTTYGYDGAGRKISETTDGAKTTFEYDSLGRLYRTSRFDKGELISTDVEIFDPADRLVEKWVEDQEGNRYLYEKYGYDPLGNRNFESRGGHVTTYIYDGLSRLIQKTDPLGHETRWTYSKKPHREKRKDPNGVATIQTFDALNRLSLQEKYDDQNLLSSVSYRYDLNDNLIEENHQIIGGDGKPFILFREYDEMNRLILLTEPLGKQTKYSYTPSGQVKTTTKPDGIVLTNTYDLRGNLISSEGYAYTYDAMGNMLSVGDVTRAYTPRGFMASDSTLGILG